MLSESAAEVRQQAKLGIHTIYNGCSGQREFDSLMMQCRLNERQMEQVRKVLKQESFGPKQPHHARTAHTPALTIPCAMAALRRAALLHQAV